MPKLLSHFFCVLFKISSLIILAVTVPNCSGKEDDTKNGDNDTVIVGLLISMSEETPFFVSLVKGANESAEEHGVELVVLYANDDEDLQFRQIGELVERGAAAILLNPVSDMLCPAIRSASSSGVPVFTIDRSISCDSVVCHIASNNIEGGMMAGVYLAETLNRKGKVVELIGTPGSSAATERGLGFNRAVSNYPQIEIVVSATACFNKADGEKVFSDILNEFPEINGVFAHNDDMILGAIEAAKKAGRLNGIVFIGFDGIEEAIVSLEKNEMSATIAQRPEEMGRIGIETIMEFLSGKDIPDTIFIELALITR
ncbi:substrate-binding domain-containing protein [candidate division WOR-3 bacterium]|nr:substrate-binding domain-containing protein [candidate division WOR-3 bacterium]